MDTKENVIGKFFAMPVGEMYFPPGVADTAAEAIPLFSLARHQPFPRGQKFVVWKAVAIVEPGPAPVRVVEGKLHD